MKNMVESTVYLNLRRSRDGSRLVVWVGGMCVCIISLLHSVRFGQLLRCAHKRIVNIIKVYSERSNMLVELMRFRKQYHLYSRSKRVIQHGPRVYAWIVVTT